MVLGLDVGAEGLAARSVEAAFNAALPVVSGQVRGGGERYEKARAGTLQFQW